jgi:integrative and conjugative element protein (TIGR02256 family)
MAEIVAECERSLPHETGGCLVGYWATREIVITEMIGPGPNALHAELNFAPDHEWQVSEIARTYEESNFVHTYLGDWHSHLNPFGPKYKLERSCQERIGDFLKEGISHAED